MELEANQSLKDTLTRVQGARAKVELCFVTGQTLKGVILAVGDQFAVLGHLEGREFFDAKIRIEEISALIVQTRTS